MGHTVCTLTPTVKRPRSSVFSRDNFNGARDDVFNGSVSLNMFCTPNESSLTVTGFERIDPANWRSPVGPIPD